MQTSRTLLILLVTALLGACDDPNALPDASITNVVDTTVIYAISGTAPAAPAGFSVIDGRAVRLDQGSAFDFAFDFRSDDVPVLLPLDLFGLDPTSAPPGAIAEDRAFDEVLVAVRNGYSRGDTIFVAPGDVYMVRSRLTCSAYGGIPQYGKIEVLDIDLGSRTVALKFLVNNNCGYRGLEPGIPGR